ncbi:hypothetical protein MAC_01930 [Metarhizium acridum CQMa 102]|uniref:Uncharacterized protein n=2 Tax=Metarhizium acridum TaxID=92637 RepID=E9DWD2_METAQ|nr:uncharacterized protein MAC_01930 [Metarhizium acridum CQMa 102]EFY91982.1 hypothetical protein MAC_01930 [Metarhizium acridum CQMa 102]
MDFLKQAVNSAQGAGGNSNNNNNNNDQQQQQQGGDNQQNQGGNNNNQNQQGGDQQDYGDKAFDFVAKKAGLNLSREQEEKITDGARQAYEKYSGVTVYSKSVDPKYSN